MIRGRVGALPPGGAPTVLVVLALASSSCGGGDKSASQAGNPYPKDVVAAYLKSCESKAKAVSGNPQPAVHAYCGCTIDYLERHLSFADFKQLDAAASKSGATPARGRRVFAGAIRSCR